MTLWGLEHMAGTFHGWDNEKDRFMSVDETDEYLEAAMKDPEAFRNTLLGELRAIE